MIDNIQKFREKKYAICFEIKWKNLTLNTMKKPLMNKRIPPVVSFGDFD